MQLTTWLFRTLLPHISSSSDTGSLSYFPHYFFRNTLTELLPGFKHVTQSKLCYEHSSLWCNIQRLLSDTYIAIHTVKRWLGYRNTSRQGL